MQNKVTLLDIAGSDKTIALSAWQSTEIETGLDLSQFEIGDDRIDALFSATQKNKKKTHKDLIKFLLKHGHETPTQKSYIHFQVCADIATHIHCLKHRIGVGINAESARYKELQDKHYIPGEWFDQETMSVSDDNELVQLLVNGNYSWADVLDDYSVIGEKLYHIAADQLSGVLGRKRAKETSRYFLSYNKQLNYDMTFNMRSFAHFCKLRASDHAQREVANIAKEMIKLVKETGRFDITLEAFGLLDLIKD